MKTILPRAQFTSSFARRFLSDSTKIPRPPRPLVKTQSINSGFALDPEEKPSENSNQKMTQSLVGANVHASYDTKREAERWKKKPLFAREGMQASFKTGQDAVDLLLMEIKRRDPYQVDFQAAAKDFIQDLAVVIEENPKRAWKLKQLLEPEAMFSFRIPWEDDNENTRINRGLLIQYSSSVGPYQGGMILNQGLSHSTIRTLGLEQTLKNAFFGFGGMKFGSDFDVKDKSEHEIESFCEAFLNSMKPMLLKANSPMGFEMDLNAGKQVMSYMKSGYQTVDVNSEFELQDQKTLFGKSILHQQSKGHGAVYFSKACLSGELREDLKGKRCLISGSASYSRFLARKLIELGAKPLTLSDEYGCIYAPDGLDVKDLELLEQFKVVNRDLSEFARSSPDSLEYIKFSVATPTVYALKTDEKIDIAYACEKQNEVNVDDVVKLQANGISAVFECMDRAVAISAADSLISEGILFAPSKLTSGGPTALERILTERELLDEEIDGELKKSMERVYEKVADMDKKYSCGGNLKKAASIASFLQLSIKEILPSSTDIGY
eukprot:maker-scaffold_6-snap-gene-4.15-mRNA-1 protein AED:0.00 eAED:0.00 QI:28/1/1/1/1/1/3/48/550